MQLMRPETNGLFYFVRDRFCSRPVRSARLHSFITMRLFYGKFRMPQKEPCDAAFILLLRKRTGRIYQPAAFFQHCGSFIQHVVLPLCTQLHVFGTPFAAGFLVLSEHPLAGAGGVHQNFIKIFREISGQSLRTFVRHNCIGQSHPLHIFRKDFCPGRMDFIADENTFSLHRCTDLGAFPAGGSAQIQHIISRLYVQISDRRHRARFLYIINASLVIRVLARCILFAVIKTVFLPCNRRQMKRRFFCKFLPVRFARIEPQRLIMTGFIALQKCFVFLSQHFLHARQKRGRQIHNIPHFNS